MALLHLQQKAKCGGAAASCTNGMVGGNDALASGCSLCRRFLQDREPRGSGTAQCLSEDGFEPHQTVQGKGEIQTSHFQDYAGLSARSALTRVSIF